LAILPFAFPQTSDLTHCNLLLLPPFVYGQHECVILTCLAQYNKLLQALKLFKPFLSQCSLKASITKQVYLAELPPSSVCLLSTELFRSWSTFGHLL